MTRPARGVRRGNPWRGEPRLSEGADPPPPPRARPLGGHDAYELVWAYRQARREGDFLKALRGEGLEA